MSGLNVKSWRKSLRNGRVYRNSDMHHRHIFKDLPETSALPPPEFTCVQLQLSGKKQSELSRHTTLWIHVQSWLQVIAENSKVNNSAKKCQPNMKKQTVSRCSLLHQRAEQFGQHQTGFAGCVHVWLLTGTNFVSTDPCCLFSLTTYKLQLKG